MNLHFQEGQVLQDRFVLSRGLRADIHAHLWFAQDLHLETQLLLRIYCPHLGSPAIEVIRHHVRMNRQLHHEHVAHIHDLHEGSGLLVVSMDPRDGELLSAVMTGAGAWPYRNVITCVRPLIEGLLYVHESTGEHGHVDPEHVLVQDQRRWVLLPGDQTKPVDSDIRQLGHLMALLLTAGQAPDRGREINDVPERLFEGRTVPALLNQLVNDLVSKDAALRTAGMHDVLRRLDQLEAFLEPETKAESPGLGSATPSASHAVANTVSGAPTKALPTETTPEATGSRVVAFMVLVVIIGATLLVAAIWTQRHHETASVEESTKTQSVSPTDPDNVDLAKIAAEKWAAEEALNRYLVFRRQVDEIGAAAWGGELHRDGATIANEADQSFMEQQYVTSAQQYAQAALAFGRLVESKDESLDRLLQEGSHALWNSESKKATVAFQNALLIDPANAKAKMGLGRANTLDELNRLLDAGRAHEQQGRLAFAHADFDSAAQLDPHSEDAIAAHRRTKDKLADEQLKAMMSGGLSAYFENDYAKARTHLTEAHRFRPTAAGLQQALDLVQEAQRLDLIRHLRDQALTFEKQEQWQGAWNAYRQVLAVDAAIAFAQEGRSRSEQMIRFDKQASHYLAHLDLLIQPGTREHASQLLQQLESVANKGPRMQQAYTALAEQVRLANTPLRIAMTSDDKTEVAVYRVRRLGTFMTVELKLLPGKYTVVGHRTGYKDVRLTFDLQPGDQDAKLQVICTERI